MSTTKRSTMLLAVVGALGLMGLAMKQDGAPAKPVVQGKAETGGRVIKPCVEWAGDDSRNREHGTHLVTSAKEWSDLWMRHCGETSNRREDEFDEREDPLAPRQAPAIDFEHYAVLAVFMGEMQQCGGVAIHSIEEFPDRVRVRIYPMGYSVVVPGGKEPPLRTPYGIFLLPKVNKRTVIESDDYPPGFKKGDPLPYVEIKRFDPPPGNPDSSSAP